MGQLTRTQGWYLCGFDGHNEVWDWLEGSKKEEVEMSLTKKGIQAFTELENRLLDMDGRLDTLERDVALAKKRFDSLEHPTVPELPSGCTFAEAMEGLARGEEWRRLAWVDNAIALTNGRIEWTHDTARYVVFATDIRATDWMRVK